MCVCVCFNGWFCVTTNRVAAGNFEVGVHIADVSYFVEEGNALDAVAGRRATSVYMVQKVGGAHLHPHGA